MASQSKTIPTLVTFDDYLATIDPTSRQEEARAIAAMMAAISGQPATMWGSSIVGFSRYHYRYDSGREGEGPRLAFSVRKSQLTLYFVTGFDDLAQELSQLGKHSVAKSCLHIKRLSDIDPQRLVDLLQASWDQMATQYPS